MVFFYDEFPKFKNMALIEEIKNGRLLSQSEVLNLCAETPLEELCQMANALREHFFGKKIDTCSIVNARSGRCSENCKWCAQSAHFKTSAGVYPLMSAEMLLEKALESDRAGISRFSFVTSGRTLSDSDVETLCKACALIRQKSKIKLCGSLGLLNLSQLQKLKDAGITRYHCNLETAPSYFPKLCTTHTVEDKLQTISYAKQVGMDVCSGGIIGMGETFEQRVEFAITLRNAGVASIPVNILNPIKGTPLENATPLTQDDILRAFAIFRITNPKAQVRFAGGRTLILDLQRKALKSGVNAAIMGDMLTTIGAKVEEDFKMFAEMGYDY